MILGPASDSEYRIGDHDSTTEKSETPRAAGLQNGRILSDRIRRMSV